LKIVFFGTSEFAARILKDLLDKSFEIVAVVTRPDRPQGRALQLVPPPVKKLLIDRQSYIPVHQPEKASTPEFQETLSQYVADLYLVVAYGEILRQHILDLPKLACINIHASLLPFYRGAAPMQRCLMDGCLKTGITIIEMVRQMDAGDMVAQAEIEIPEDMNLGQLDAKLMELSFSLVPKVLQNFSECFKNKVAQDTEKVTFAAKILPEELEIDWNLPAKKIHDKIRALSPTPSAWSKVKIGDDVKRLKVKSSSVVSGVEAKAGSIISLNKEIVIACSEGALRLIEVQLEGKKSMFAGDFLKGIHQEINFI